MAESVGAVERYDDFSFAFNNKDHANRVLTLHWYVGGSGGSPGEVSSSSSSSSPSSPQKRSETLYVNTAILGKESEYFRVYFFGGFVESWQLASSQDPRGIHVDDRDCMVVLLKAIYAGGQLPTDICDDVPTLLRLLMLSDEYRVNSVMASCARALQRNAMTLQLAVEVLTLPQHIQECEQTKGLMAQARRYVEKAFPDLDAQVASSTSELWSLPLQALECLLASPRVKVQSEDTVFFLILEWARRHLPRGPSRGKAVRGSDRSSPSRSFPESSSIQSPPAATPGGNDQQGKDGTPVGGDKAAGQGKDSTAGQGKDCGKDGTAVWGEKGVGSPVGSPVREAEFDSPTWEMTGGCNRVEALRRLWALVRLPQMSGECLIAIRKFEDAALWVDVNRVEEALRVKLMDPRGVSLLFGTMPPYVPRPGKRTGPALLVWAVTEKEIMELSGTEVKESTDRVFVCGNWYCIELRKTGLGTLFDNNVVIRLVERERGPPGHPFVSIKGKRVVEASCTVGTPSRSRVSKGSCSLICFGVDTPPQPSPPKPETKLNPNPNPNLGELTVGSSLFGPQSKENLSLGPKLAELTWDLGTQRYIHPMVGSVFDDNGVLQITVAFQPLSAWV